jgi:hypothetical protein
MDYKDIRDFCQKNKFRVLYAYVSGKKQNNKGIENLTIILKPFNSELKIVIRGKDIADLYQHITSFIYLYSKDINFAIYI